MEILTALEKGDDTFLQTNASYLVKQIDNDTLDRLSSSQKTKLAVKISSFLKSKGLLKPIAANLVAHCLVDTEICKSHASSWAPILLHMLDLPDQTCWNNSIKALCILYTHHETRELPASSKPADFIKRLVNLIPKIPDSACKGLVYMLDLNPGPVRTYIPQIRAEVKPLVWSACSDQALQLLAALEFAEKVPAAIWRQHFICLLTDCVEKEIKWLPSPPIQQMKAPLLFKALEVYTNIRPQGAKLPQAKLVETLETALKSDEPLSCLQFIVNTADLERVYAQNFDLLFHLVVEASNYNQQCLEKALECTTVLINAIKTLPQKYMTNLVSLFKRGESRQKTALLASLAASIILACNQIPPSFRSKLDAAVLAAGGEPLRIATLYPGRFSVLPLALEKTKLTDGYEALIHPRFPPLGQVEASSTHLDQSETEVIAQAAPSGVSITKLVVDETMQEPVERPILPEVHLESVPKRQEHDVHESTEKRRKVQDETIEAQIEKPLVRQAVETSDDDDDDDELVIPELELDSD